MTISAVSVEAPPHVEQARAAVVGAPGRMHLERGEARRPGPGEVAFRVDGCGVCGSNVPVWEGRSWFEYPLEAGAPGHEGWGRITELGEGVQGLRPGQRVAALSYRAFADSDVARADAVVPLPPSLDGIPFPGEALGCAMNVFRRSGIEAGQTVAIVGIGFLGAVVAQLARGAGARVLALSRRPFALQVGRDAGAEEAIPLDEAAAERVGELTAGEGCHVVVEATGAQAALDVAGELTRVRGRLIIAGYHQDGLRQVNMQLWNWRGLDVINAHERDGAEYVRGIRDAVAAVESGRLDPAPLFTHAYPLDRLDEALEAARTRPDGFLKALVLP